MSAVQGASLVIGSGYARGCFDTTEATGEAGRGGPEWTVT